jgi:hypothetical protein
MIALLAIPLIILAALWDHLWRKRHPKTATASEWREGMARLDSQMPLPAPRFRSRYCAKGAPGVSFPEPKPKSCNIAPKIAVIGKKKA